MDFETLERLWRSEANTQPGVAEAYVLEETMKTLTQRRSHFAGGMMMAGLALVVWTGVIVHAHVVRHVINPEREWGAYLMLGIAWAVYINVVARYQRHIRRYPDTGATMPEALTALIDENRVAQIRARVMAVALAAFVCALGVALWQLHAVGKMEPRHVFQGSIVFGGAILFSAAVQAVTYFRVTKPEARRLKALLDQYDS